VLFTVDFEQILSSDIFKQIETIQQPTTTPFYRIYPISQRALLNDGSTVQKSKFLKKKAPDVTQRTFSHLTQYTGNKWGGEISACS
jgi:hypothetical protein